MPSIRAFVLSLALAAVAAAPVAAHSPRVFVPEPRQVSPEVQYRVVILASNLGSVPRRLQVSRIIPQPLGAPPGRERLHSAYLPGSETRTFTVADPSDLAGVLEVVGAPQLIVRARLEIWEGETRLSTTALPAVAAHEHEDAAGDKHGGTDEAPPNDVHLQGLASTIDGRVTTDVTLVNFDGHAEGECAVSIVDSKGAGLLGLPFLHLPAGAGISFQDVLAEAEFSGDIQEAWAALACEEDTFTAWAAVYRNGGREVEYVLPSAELKR